MSSYSKLTKISRRADHGPSEGLLSNDPREAEVTQLDLRELLVRGQQHVLRLQVAVHDVLLVQVLQGYQDLRC